MCWHAKLDEQLDAGAARSCANLRTKEAAAPTAAKPASFRYPHLEAWMRLNELDGLRLVLLNLACLLVRHSLD